MSTRRNWTREELILAFNLYCKTPFGQIHNRNPTIVELASLINRSPSAVSWKLANFARLDPTIISRGLTGATHGSKKEKVIWDEFHQDWDSLSYESERLIAKLQNINIEEQLDLTSLLLPKVGAEREAIVKIRVNQNFFRATVLASYHYKCCITGLGVLPLLNASHIVPWSFDEKNRVNPRNGLCLNALHDRAFDRGLLTITENFEVLLSPILRNSKNSTMKDYFIRYDGELIDLPDKFLPDQELLAFHRTDIFQKYDK